MVDEGRERISVEEEWARAAKRGSRVAWRDTLRRWAATMGSGGVAVCTLFATFMFWPFPPCRS